MNEHEYKQNVRKELERMRWQASLSMIKSNEQYDLMGDIVDWHIAEIKKAIDEYKTIYYCTCDEFAKEKE